jgi:hypothetical protein
MTKRKLRLSAPVLRVNGAIKTRKRKKAPWLLVRKRIIPIIPMELRSRPENLVPTVAWSAQRIPTAVNLRSLDRVRYFFFKVAAQLSSHG